MYFSLAPNPGYNNSFLKTRGIRGEWDLFLGNFSNGIWRWGSVNHSIEGNHDSLRTIANYISEDVWSQSRLDVMEVFKYLEMGETASFKYYSYWPSNMTEKKMMIDTRPRYPSNKLTFTIANITKGKPIRFVNILLNSFAKFDVDIFFEDSKRNFM